MLKEKQKRTYQNDCTTEWGTTILEFVRNQYQQQHYPDFLPLLENILFIVGAGWSWYYSKCLGEKGGGGGNASDNIVYSVCHIIQNKLPKIVKQVGTAQSKYVSRFGAADFCLLQKRHNLCVQTVIRLLLIRCTAAREHASRVPNMRQ